jgi:nicotinate-nucleotide adenylyltransferase
LAESTPIGVIGGSFDPIHNGHLALARVCLEAGEVGQILLVPAAQAPLRAAPAANSERRLRMCRLAAEADDRLEVCEIEVHRRRAYTVDTLARLAQIYPGRRLALIIGTDLLAELSQWRDVPGILARAAILVVTRGGCRQVKIPEWVKQHSGELRHILADTPQISSTLVRSTLAAGGSIDEFVPDPVADYIRRNRLYSRTKCR